MRTSIVKRWMLTLVAAGTIAAVLPGSSSAVVRDTDYPRISGSQADFGSGSHVAGASAGTGTLTWDQSASEPSTYTARLTGYVYWDDLFAGGCARVRYRLFTTTGSYTESYSGRVCRIGVWTGTVPKKYVDLTLTTAKAHKVVVTTQIAADSGSPSSAYRDTKSQTWYQGQVNGQD